MFKIKYIKKHNEVQMKKEGKKMQKLSNFLNKKSCKFFKAKWLAMNLIINGDQIFSNHARFIKN
jgi:hypothetical protein